MKDAANKTIYYKDKDEQKKTLMEQNRGFICRFTCVWSFDLKQKHHQGNTNQNHSEITPRTCQND